MEKIAQLPADVASNLRGICFDIDDTVTTHGTLDPAALMALHDLRSDGLTLLACTGRPLGWAEVVARTWPIDGAVGENGAGWIGVRDQQLIRGYLDPPDVRAEHQRKLEALRVEVEASLPDLRVTEDGWARRCDLSWDINEFQQVEEATVQQLVAQIEAAGALSVVSTVHAHAAFSHADKPTGAIAATRELFDLDLPAEKDRWLFVGDSGNDAAAFAWFPVSAGVANVRDFLPSLTTPPRYVAESAYGSGFAEIAATVLAKRAD